MLVYQRVVLLFGGLHSNHSRLDEKVAALHLPSLGANLTKLSKEQADYIGVGVDGPFKQDTYRY